MVSRLPLLAAASNFSASACILPARSLNLAESFQISGLARVGRPLSVPSPNADPRQLGHRHHDRRVVGGGLGVERHAALRHRADAAQVVGHHRERALAVLDGVFGLLELRGGGQADQRGKGGNAWPRSDSSCDSSSGGLRVMTAVQPCRQPGRRRSVRAGRSGYSIAGPSQCFYRVGEPSVRVSARRASAIVAVPPFEKATAAMSDPAAATTDEPALPATRAVRVWDLPTRLFHWLLAAARAGAGDHRQDRRRRDGLALSHRLLRVRAARLPAGVGPDRRALVALLELRATVRPRVLRYLRGEPPAGRPFPRRPQPAGQPARCWRCWRCWWFRSATGLVADDEIASVGPLNRYVSSAIGQQRDGLAQGRRPGPDPGAGGAAHRRPSSTTATRKRQGPGAPDGHRRQGRCPPTCRRASTRGWRALRALALIVVWARPGGRRSSSSEADRVPRADAGNRPHRERRRPSR